MTACKALATLCVLGGLLAGSAWAVDIETVPVGDPGNVGELSGAVRVEYGPDVIVRRSRLHVQHRQVRGNGRAVHGVPQRRGRDGHVRAVQHENVVRQLRLQDSAERFLGQLHVQRGERLCQPSRELRELGRRSAVRQLAAQQSADGGAGPERRPRTARTTSTARRRMPSFLAVNRETDWKWAITSEDEWYKAAYYKGGSTGAGYWDYPDEQRHRSEVRDLADASGEQRQLLRHGRTRSAARTTRRSLASSRTAPAPTAHSTRAVTCGSGMKPYFMVRIAACAAARSTTPGPYLPASASLLREALPVVEDGYRVPCLRGH
jgi:hypothetical protein